MATRTTIALEDDINGGPAQETLQFRLGTAEYEIDLNAKNAHRFRTQMAPFIDHARKAGRRQRRPARPASAREHSADIRAWAKAHDIRAWAKAHDIQVSDRGRIPASVIEQYESRTTEH